MYSKVLVAIHNRANFDIPQLWRAEIWVQVDQPKQVISNCYNSSSLHMELHHVTFLYFSHICKKGHRSWSYRYRVFIYIAAAYFIGQESTLA